MLLATVVAVSNSSDNRNRDRARAAASDIPDAECRTALDLIFAGRADEAAVYIDSLETRYGRSPLYRLTRARVYREFLPIDDENKDVVKEMAQPIHADIDLAIEECTRRIESGDDDPLLLLYRGWGWMFKSHIRTFERSFWSAGRDAKKGKGDLIEYLERYPEDPIATGIMGAFLYFADTLPSAYKFISKLLFMPSGDREEGLRLMEMSCSRPSLIEADNKTLLYSVYMAFEGRYEDGLVGFARLQRRYPVYSAFARPFAVLSPFSPRARERDNAVVDGVVNRARNVPHESGTPSYALLRFSRAYADRFYDPAAARVEFEALIGDAPAHPDWLVGYAHFSLARMAAADGDADRARKHFRAVLEDKRTEYLHGDVRDMLETLDEGTAASAVDVDVAAIYHGDREKVGALADALGAITPATVQSDFYRAEALLMLGRSDAAADLYRGVVARTIPEWDESFQMIACSRLGEIKGASLEYEQAARYLDMASSFYHKEFLFDWFYEGRARFYNRLANGELHTVPSLFSTVQ